MPRTTVPAPLPPDAAEDQARTRERARRTVRELAARLSDPDDVVKVTTRPDNLDRHPGKPGPRSPWTPLTLAEGHTGVALLFAELSRADAAYRTTGHAHLAAAAGEVGTPTASGLFYGVPSLAFAARISRHAPDDYARLLERLDAKVTARLRADLAQEHARLDAGRPGVAMSTYDVISGATGLGRYLLLAEPRHHDLLAGTLTYLIRLTHPVTAHGHSVPGWWVPTQPSPVPDPRFARGHLNLGLAHGICGPLALLSLAWEAGVRVPGQLPAIARIAEHLLDHQLDTGLWPRAIGFDDFTRGTWTPGHGDAQVAWCYGTPGVARTLHLAGRALHRPDWQERAVRGLDSALSLSPRLPGNSLCHGRAGLLHITSLMAHDSADPHLTAHLPGLANTLLDAYDPAHPFGYRHDTPKLPADQLVAPHRAGFLQGTAGIALALHTFATPSPPPRPWDAALLLK
ncbi:lanthionine synthetase C family protein [Streptomyces sp. NPDC050161]|uniref:lanthionine synthetase C family protein n=1 Tax=Streptomyces sp. NPDC050161 TaxID=3365604 RepID=UPI00378F795B